MPFCDVQIQLLFSFFFFCSQEIKYKESFHLKKKKIYHHLLHLYFWLSTNGKMLVLHFLTRDVQMQYDKNQNYVSIIIHYNVFFSNLIHLHI